MLIYKVNNEEDHIILFGTSGWSNYFMASFKELDKKTIKALWNRAQKLLPNEIKETHPANEKVSWLRIYKFNKEFKDGEL